MNSSNETIIAGNILDNTNTSSQTAQEGLTPNQLDHIETAGLLTPLIKKLKSPWIIFAVVAFTIPATIFIDDYLDKLHQDIDSLTEQVSKLNVKVKIIKNNQIPIRMNKQSIDWQINYVKNLEKSHQLELRLQALENK